MREIIFRGRREYNGEWVEGSLLLWPDGSAEICYPHPDREEELLKVIVDPNTVGQYTGLKDKNGKKIFEGDMVVSYDLFGLRDGCGIVQWNDLFAAWHMDKTSMYGPNIATYEVIGNIHDNPEPPKEETK